MDDTRIYKYYRSSGYDINALIYQLLITDSDLRSYLRFSPYCGAITFLVCVFVIVVITCTITNLSTVRMNEGLFWQSQKEANQKLPRKESIVKIGPAYNCIHKHMQQTEIFQEKTRKMLCKEHLELEMMNSRISCIIKLLKPETQSQWRRSRSPKEFHRTVNPASK